MRTHLAHEIQTQNMAFSRKATENLGGRPAESYDSTAWFKETPEAETHGFLPSTMGFKQSFR